MKAHWAIGLVAFAVLVASRATAAQVAEAGRGQGPAMEARDDAGCPAAAARESGDSAKTTLAETSSKTLEGAADVVGAAPDAINKGATRVGTAVGLDGPANKAFGKATGMVIGIGGKAALASKAMRMVGKKVAPKQPAKPAADEASASAACRGTSGAGAK